MGHLALTFAQLHVLARQIGTSDNLRPGRARGLWQTPAPAMWRGSPHFFRTDFQNVSIELSNWIYYCQRDFPLAVEM